VVTFGAAPTPTYLGGNFTVSASTTNTDSAALTYSRVSGPCALVSGATFGSSGAGTCKVQASGAETTNFLAASNTQDVTIAKATPTIIFGSAPTAYLGGNFTVSATTNSDGTLTYSQVSGPCTLVNASTGAFSALAVGTCVVRASTPVTTNFNAGSADQSVNVQYGFVGLQSPYAPPSDRAFKIKSAIPLKWQYTNASGVAVPSPNAAPAVAVVNATCVGLDGVQDIVVEDAGNSGYQYDPTTYMWQYNWKTTGLAASCYNIRINTGQTGQTAGPFLIQLIK
jgi:hypothetical protein